MAGTSVEGFLSWDIILPIVIIIISILMLYFSAGGIAAYALPVGPNDNNLCENQFTHAEYGWPNRLEGTSLFPSLLTDCCYDALTAKSTCITHWCYYNISQQYDGGNEVPYSQQNLVQSCISNPPKYILNQCSVISPSNTAALMSCDHSTILADNSTFIENCDISNPECLPGDSKYCPPCE